MRALVYNGPNSITWQEVPAPRIEKPTDAIVKIETTTICGTDLHILKGDVPTVQPGRILGHEGVGVVTEVGEAVTEFTAGDRVIVSCISSPRGRLELGSASEVIRDAAQNASLLVVGSHGRGWVGRFFLGSVSQDVLLTIASPTVVVRPAE